MQENIDESMLSRAYSYDSVGSFVAMPVGQLIYGPLGDMFGYREVFIVSAVVYAANKPSTRHLTVYRVARRRTHGHRVRTLTRTSTRVE